MRTSKEIKKLIFDNFDIPQGKTQRRRMDCSIFANHWRTEEELWFTATIKEGVIIRKIRNTPFITVDFYTMSESNELRASNLCETVADFIKSKGFEVEKYNLSFQVNINY